MITPRCTRCHHEAPSCRCVAPDVQTLCTECGQWQTATLEHAIDGPHAVPYLLWQCTHAHSYRDRYTEPLEGVAPMTADTPTPERCTSCGEPIFKLRHERTGNVSPITVKTLPGGNVAITGDTYRIVPRHERTGPLHLNHFTDCPHAAQHHRPTPHAQIPRQAPGH